jgi:hypothetical protein
LAEKRNTGDKNDSDFLHFHSAGKNGKIFSSEIRNRKKKNVKMILLIFSLTGKEEKIETCHFKKLTISSV